MLLHRQKNIENVRVSTEAVEDTYKKVLKTCESKLNRMQQKRQRSESARNVNDVDEANSLRWESHTRAFYIHLFRIEVYTHTWSVYWIFCVEPMLVKGIKRCERKGSRTECKLRTQYRHSYSRLTFLYKHTVWRCGAKWETHSDDMPHRRNGDSMRSNNTTQKKKWNFRGEQRNGEKIGTGNRQQ